MKVKDIREICFEEVCVYERIGEMDYQDIYSGVLQSASEIILEREIVLVGASDVKKGLMEIQVQ